jgi:hypothetical protein
MLDVNEVLMFALCPNRCIMAKDAENKENSLKANELKHSSNGNGAKSILFSPNLESEMSEKDDNPFPFKSFPAPLQEIIIQNKQCLRFPHCFTGTSILYTASVAIGNTHWVHIKKGFRVPVVLYCALVGKIGVTKSHPLKFAIEPLVKRDGEAADCYKNSEILFAAYEKMSSAEKKQSEKVSPPVLRKYLMGDFTPESLQVCHANNLRGLGAYQDELMAWINNFNRYNKGSAEQFWLSNQSGTFTDNLRTEKYTRINHSFVSVIGTIQPELLKAFGQERIHNGFLDRILFDFPMGLMKEYWTEDELSDECFTIYDEIIGKLLDMPFKGKPNYILFEKSAKKKLFEWQRVNTDIANEKKNFESGICSKYDTILPRIALILQMLHDVCAEKDTTEIELSNVEKAIELIEYYRVCARRVYAVILDLEEEGRDKKRVREEQKKRAIELHKEGKSIAEIARLVLGDEKLKGTIHRWVQ